MQSDTADIEPEENTGKRTTNTRVYTASVECLSDPVRYQKAREMLPEQRRESADRMKVESGKRLSAGAGLLLMAALADYLCGGLFSERHEAADAKPYDTVQLNAEQAEAEQSEVEQSEAAAEQAESEQMEAGQMEAGQKVPGRCHKVNNHLGYTHWRSAAREMRSLRFEFGKNGKPYLPERKEVHFNLSHSGSRVMCIVSDREVGCDVEVIDPRSVSKVIRCLADSEQVLASESAENFFRIWTLKESILKLSGKGLEIPLRSFEVTLDPPKVRQGFLPGQVSLKEYDEFRSGDFGDEAERYCCSCAIEGGSLPEQMTQVDLREIVG